MFKIDSNNNIHITRGDIGTLNVRAKDASSGGNYTFKQNDIIRFGIFEKDNMNNIIKQIDVTVDEDSEVVSIDLTKEDTRIGEIINMPEDYWYEIQLNPDTNPQTIIGYDEDGPTLFILYPEGVEKE